MSLIVTAYTQEGIVIGADSCITTNFTQEGKELYKHSHCGNKRFLLNKKIGISTCGDAIINGILLSSLIDQYIWSKKEENITLLQVEIDLKNIVNNQAKGKEYYVIFHICGYENGKRYVSKFDNNDKESHIKDVSERDGCIYDGQVDIVDLFSQDVAYRGTDGLYYDINIERCRYNELSLQETIEYVYFLISTTIQYMRFTYKKDNVGFPIDILVIMPNESLWLQKKELHIPGNY